MTFRSRLGVLRSQLLSSVHRRPLSLGDQGPIVSFCFDDFPRTAYTAGGSILKSFDVLGTYYAALGLINTSNALGDQFTQADLHSLVADGHELGCHTFNHSSCRNLSRSSFELDVLKGREAIRHEIGYDAANFAYPYGHVSMRAKGVIGAQMNSCRGIFNGINEGVADLNLLRANSLYGGADGSAKIEALLAQNVRSRGWLIFYTHDVRQKHSPFGCTPALLDRAISLAVKNGSRIAPVKAAIDIFRKVASERSLAESEGRFMPLSNN